MKSLVTRISKLFELDYRSVALMRITIGLILVADIIGRFCNLKAHYSDAGILPRKMLLEYGYDRFYISLHMASGLAGFEAILLLIALVAAIALAIGYRTQLAVFISWILLISIQTRNPLIVQGADVVLRCVLFFMLFLPLAKRFSLDSFLGRIPRAKTITFITAAGAAYMTQVALVYFMSALLKTGIAWHDGSAIYQALSLEQFTTGFGHWLSTKDALTFPLTHIVYYIELLIPFFLFWPNMKTRVRTIAIFIFAALQIGINLSFGIGLFGLIMIAITLGMLPSSFWEDCKRLFTKIRTRQATLAIYYDGECTFCARVVHMLAKLLFLPIGTLLAPATGTIETLMSEHNSWVIEQNGKHFFGFDGAIALAHESPWAKHFVFLIEGQVIRTWGTRLYELIAKKRKTICVVQTEVKPHKTKTYIRNTIVLAALASILWWNIETLPKDPLPKMPFPVRAALVSVRLDQKFDMFAPTPLLDDGWYIIPATLADGTEFDLFRNAPVSFVKPNDITYKSQRWQKYFVNLYHKNYSNYRKGYADYLCNSWNASHAPAQKLLHFDVLFMLERTRANHMTDPIEKSTLWTATCN